MRVSFLEAQRHRWRRVLEAAGVLTNGGDAASQKMLSGYLRGGGWTAGQGAPDDHDAVWKQVRDCLDAL